jgi:hypothetical protein
MQLELMYLSDLVALLGCLLRIIADRTLLFFNRILFVLFFFKKEIIF